MDSVAVMKHSPSVRSSPARERKAAPSRSFGRGLLIALPLAFALWALIAWIVWTA